MPQRTKKYGKDIYEYGGLYWNKVQTILHLKNEIKKNHIKNYKFDTYKGYKIFWILK